MAFSFHSRAASRRTESLFRLSEIILSNLIGRPLMIKYRSFPSSADRLTEAIYIWEPVRPLRKPRQSIESITGFEAVVPFRQARPELARDPIIRRPSGAA